MGKQLIYVHVKNNVLAMVSRKDPKGTRMETEHLEDERKTQ